MTENSTNSEERMKDADRERIGLLKHISVVSLGAMAFIGGGAVTDIPWHLKAAVVCFLLSAFCSLLALIVDIANLRIPRDSPLYFLGTERSFYRKMLIGAIVFVFCGGMFLVVRVLFS